MKVGIVYTATIPESVKAINAEIGNKFGDNLESINYQDSTILDEVCEYGYYPQGIFTSFSKGQYYMSEMGRGLRPEVRQCMSGLKNIILDKL